MYNWRKMTEEQRKDVLRLRKLCSRPWHSPPHRDCESNLFYIISSACYEHKHFIGTSLSRLAHFAQSLCTACDEMSAQLSAWCVLPNHYHLLLRTDRIRDLRLRMGRLHGRTSRQWNLEDECVGRKVWFNCIERMIRCEAHYWATVNYIHHNPVKHGFVDKWTQWPFSSAGPYLDKIGKDKAAEIWKRYPILDYGKDWDK